MELKNFMMKKIIGWTSYIIILIGIFGFIIAYNMYRDAVIFPPTTPANLQELANWSETDLWRLKQYYNCGDLPFDNVPDDLIELKTFCKIISNHWVKKYDERLYEKARDGAAKLKQNNQ